MEYNIVFSTALIAINFILVCFLIWIGKPIRINKDNSIEIIESDPTLEELNKFCYFCDFNEISSHQHHIIRSCDGGKNILNNKIPLCANHHELIHRRIYILVFSKGFYYLKNRINDKIITPTDRQKTYKRKLPISSIKNNSNLILEGNLNSKGKVIIKDIYKRVRKKQKNKIKSLKRIENARS
jgi:hypothetical protein